MKPEPAAEGYLAAGGAELYYRAVGQGPPVIVLHGGPDFSHHYLLPELDQLAGAFRLIYYDQRGRGASARGVRPEDVTLASELDDLDRVRAHFGLEQAAVLGHSWGGVLALEYALRHPARVARLILLNTGPASRADNQLMRAAIAARRAPGEAEALKALRATPEFQAGDLAADAAYHRRHFGVTVRQPAHLEQIVTRLRAGTTPAGIVLARAIEHRLYAETWAREGYDRLPALRGLTAPILVLHGDYDFIPLACAAHIAAALPYARLEVVPDCGHFSYLEQPAAVRRALNRFFAET